MRGRCNKRSPQSKLTRKLPQTKINVTSKSPVGDISVVTLIRTDTTLDHSQKAEKVCWSCLEHSCGYADHFRIFVSIANPRAARASSVPAHLQALVPFLLTCFVAPSCCTMQHKCLWFQHAPPCRWQVPLIRWYTRASSHRGPY